MGPTSHCYSGAGIGVGSLSHCHPDETALQRSGEHDPLPIQAANMLQQLAELPEEEEEEEE